MKTAFKFLFLLLSAVAFGQQKLSQLPPYLGKLDSVNLYGVSKYQAYQVSAGDIVRAVKVLPAPNISFGATTNTQMVVTWDSIPGASNYILLRNTANSLAGAVQRYAGSSLTYTDTGLTAPRTYYYFITAQGVNYVTSAFSQNANTTVVPGQAPLGDIYNKSTWTDLTDFTQTGSEFSVSGGKILQVPTASGKLEFPNATMLDAFKFRIRFKITNPGSGIQELLIKWNSVNPYSSPHFLFSMVAGNDATYKGQLHIQNTATGNNFLSGTGNRVTFSTNDVIEYELDYPETDPITFYVRNITTGTTNSVTYPHSFASGGQGLGRNTSKIQILGQSMNTEITQIQYSTTENQNPTRLVTGNSIAAGSYAGTYDKRFGTLIGAEISAGGGDNTAEVLAHLPEIINVIKAKKVFIGPLAGNDVLRGVSSATWQANLTSIYNQLIAAGISVVFLLDTPRSDVDVTTVNNFITATWPTKYIDTYTPLKGTGTTLNATYNSGDGVHPNQAGHTLIATTIQASPLY